MKEEAKREVELEWTGLKTYNPLSRRLAEPTKRAVHHSTQLSFASSNKTKMNFSFIDFSNLRVSWIDEWNKRYYNSKLTRKVYRQ